MTGDEGENSVIFIYTKDPHPVHERWAESIDADKMQVPRGKEGFYSLEPFKMRKYDVVLCEDSYSMRLAAFHKKFLRGKFQIIRIIGDSGYFHASERGTALKGGDFAARNADGAIAISELVKGNAEPFFDCEIKIVNPFILEERFESLGNLEYTPDTEKLLFVGKHEKKEESRKGLDYLEKAVQLVEDKGYDLQIRTTGNSGEKIDYNANIEDRGFVDEEEFLKLFEESELFLQPSRRDGWSVAVLEAMRSGTPPIVSEHTGSKVLVKEIDENLVHDMSAESLADSIEYFLDLSHEEKKDLSEKFRQISKRFDQKSKQKEFREKFRRLINGD